MSDRITITLTKPITLGEGERAKTWTELTFDREAELGDMIAADSVSGEMGKTAAVLASMCGVPFPAFKKLSMRDMNKLMSDVGHLLGNDQKPAETGAE